MSVYVCRFLGEPPGEHHWSFGVRGDVDPDDYDADPAVLCCPDHDARCAICRRPIARHADPPLCDICHRTGRAAGKMLADARRYPDPEVAR